MEKKLMEKELNKLKINFTDGGILIVLTKNLNISNFKTIKYNGRYLKFHFDDDSKLIILPTKVNKLIISLIKSKKHEIFVTNEDKYLENIININFLPL